MTKKTKIYTKTGDQGKTSLLGGSRVYKSDPRIDLYGEIDELNSHVGFLTTLLGDSKFIAQVDFLRLIQSQLFNLGAYFACEIDKVTKFDVLGVEEEMSSYLELRMDEMDADLGLLKNFILPGGHSAAAYTHVCRTVCRRLERKMQAQYIEDKTYLKNFVFINRLSDFFFILGRSINALEGHTEPLWSKNSKK